MTDEKPRFTITMIDITMLVLAVGLMIILYTLVVGDFEVALAENRPVDKNITSLLSQAIAGIIGILSAYGAVLALKRKVKENG